MSVATFIRNALVTIGIGTAVAGLATENRPGAQAVPAPVPFVSIAATGDRAALPITLATDAAAPPCRPDRALAAAR